MRPRPKRQDLPVKKRVNEQIRIPQIQVIDHLGRNLGVVPTEKAKQLAQEAGLDLVEIQPNASPPLCKIMDFGKFKYQESKKASDSKKKQHHIKTKEVRLSPKIEENDLQTKIKNVRKFLMQGDKVMVSLRFKGREIVHKEIGFEQMQRIVDAVGDIGKLEGKVEMQGRQIVVNFSPDRRAIEIARRAAGITTPIEDDVRDDEGDESGIDPDDDDDAEDDAGGDDGDAPGGTATAGDSRATT